MANVIAEPTLHNHDLDQPADLNRQKLNNVLKRKSTSDACVKTSTLICSELSKGVISSTASDINLVRKNVYNAHRSLLPKFPTNIEKVHNVWQQNSVLTAENKHFLIVNDEQTNIVLFLCERNLRFLSQIKTIYIDGTFQYWPNFILQIFTFHGLINDYYISPAFFLLPDKQTNFGYTKKYTKSH